MTNKIKAVLVSDVHVSLSTREVSLPALQAALSFAEENKVPLIIAGDLHDTKAILRGECVNLLLNVFKNAKTPVKLLVGNHDKLSEKGEGNSLEFLRPFVDLIDQPKYDEQLQLGFIPYQSSNEKFIEALSLFKSGSTLIVHQGFMGAYMGEYVKDESSVKPELVKPFKVISGHYHKHQKLGTVTYIGSPYTVTFTEANDGPKGFLALFEGNTFEQIPLNLRKHVIYELDVKDLGTYQFNRHKDKDLVWLKLSGNSLDLDKVNKNKLIKEKFNSVSLKVDKIYTDQPKSRVDLSNKSKDTILDIFIEADESLNQDQKKLIKQLYLDILNENS